IVALAGVYDWKYTWHPENTLFELFPTTSPQIAPFTTATSQGIEGHVDVVSKVTVTADIDLENNQLGKVFTKVFGMTAFYCSNPWPYTGMENSVTDLSVSLGNFTDTKFNFFTNYCADADNPLSKADDLPLFDSVVSIEDLTQLGAIGTTNPSDSLRRYLFFSSTTEDVIGIQVFKNEPKLDGSYKTLQGWYIDKFGELGDMQLVSVGGYEALTDGTNFYVSAHNVDTSVESNGVVWGNVYLFGINQNASQKSLLAFEQMVNNLNFNINLTNHSKCLNSTANITNRIVMNDISDVSCITDSQCLQNNGIPTTTLSGVCSNIKTKFFRDLTRLRDLSTAQKNLDKYFDANFGTPAFVGNLASGSYLPGYSNSKWNNSWSLLNQKAGAIPVDPVNEWRGCSDHDPSTCWSSASSTFKCPQFAQVYEYKFVSTTQSYNIYAPFEFLLGNTYPGDSLLINQFIDNRIKFERSCTSNDIVSLYETSCGDGILSPAFEQCDPPGKEQISGTGTSVGCNSDKVKVLTCGSNCQWMSSACKLPQNNCGNGIKDWGEACDDGNNNGKIGKCNSTCTGLTEPLCGNDTLDVGEFCDTVGGICKHLDDGTNVTRAQAYLLLGRYGSAPWAEEIIAANDFVNQMTKEVDIGVAFFPGLSDYTDLNKYICNPVEMIPMGTNFVKDTVFDTFEQITAATGYGQSMGLSLKYVLDNESTIFTDDSLPKNLILLGDSSSSALPPLGICGVLEYTNPGIDKIIGLVKLLYNKNIHTYVLAVNANDNNKINLNKIAFAGGTNAIIEVDADVSNIINAFKQTMACKPYSKNKIGSCSWDCQSFGGYCGDKIVQWDKDEACDDGNKNNTDACTNNCTVNTAPSVCGDGKIEGTEVCDDGNTQDGDTCSAKCDKISVPLCGDGKINQPSEQCDLGTAQNGVVCTADYNSSCTYCRNDCKVETLESVYGFCGNEKVDFKDTNANGTKDFSEEWFEKCDYTLDLATGKQKTIFVNTLDDNNIWTCDDAITSEEKYSLNNDVVGTLSCDTSCTILNTSNCVECGITDNGVKPQIAVLNVMTGDQSNGAPMDDAKWEQSMFFDIYSNSGKILYTGDSLNFDNGYSLFKSYDLFNNNSLVGLVVNKQCSEFYQIKFKEGDYLPYSAPKDEIVVSPALPPDDVRVVVRWDKSKNPDLKFVGNLYIGTQSDVFLYASTKPVNSCNKIQLSLIKALNYWLPDSDCTSVENIYFHHLIERGNTGVQAYTFTSSSVLNNIGFFVSSLNGPINHFKNADVWVDVYYHHENDNPEYSIYKPDLSFSLSNADSSNNVDAAYWHVFNLIKNGNEYKAYDLKGNLINTTINNGVIKTNICEIKKDISGITQCQIN
ncbi:MAG: DUF4215 domain-containing protein, partial [Candidatus Magasanikbacteria bacterium]|nr:DUF4215 domain-containing protein [Candidatus Magasanikbacteria bacterium]